MLIGGLATIGSPTAWPNDVATGVVEVLASPVFFPPLLSRLRMRLAALRPAWAPPLLWIAIILVAMGAGLPFLPSPERQQQLKIEAIADADRMVAAGQPFQARMRLGKFSGRQASDPAVAAAYAKIAASERAANAKTTSNSPALSPQVAPTAIPPVVVATVADTSAVDAQAQLTTMKALQERMNDPTSLVVVGNRIMHETDDRNAPVLRSYVEYRGSNAYGGTVTERAVLTLSLDGKTVLSIVDATATR